MTYEATWTGQAVSSNRRLRSGRARLYADPDYAAFKRSLSFTFAAARIKQGWQCTREDVAVEIRAWLPARMDGEAIQKPVLDALELAGVVENDRQCIDVRTRREGTASFARIAVVVRCVEDVQRAIDGEGM
jgi:Holliday junction resolvase RusA-like endonuclease